ncbi:MAG: hypothetical protein TYPL_3950 [Candidatus Tyloplasma litorale]|nr:MAG: hypothetical protein TYPL_3950 [Mycoplasmatales bacterium]
MLKKIIIFLSILLIPLFFIFSIFNILEKNNLTPISNSSYNVKENEEYSPDPYIDSFSIGYPAETYTSMRVDFNDVDYVNEHYEDIYKDFEIKFAEFEEPIVYSDDYDHEEPYILDLAHSADHVTYIIYNLDQFTTYHVEYVTIDNDSTTQYNTNNISFTANRFPYVQDIELVDDSITSNSIQIKAKFISMRYSLQSFIEGIEGVEDQDINFRLKLEDYDELLAVGYPIDDITLTYDENIYSYSNVYDVLNDESYYEEICLFTISGLEPSTTYTIKEANLDGTYYDDIEHGDAVTTNFNLSFTTNPPLATITNIEIINGLITDSSAQIKVSTSTTNFDENDLVLQLDGHDGNLTIGNPVDGITLNHDLTSETETEIYYTISGLNSNTKYTITSAELNDISANDIDISFTTLETPATVNSIEIVDDLVTNSSAQIKVTTSTTNFDENDLILHLDDYDEELTIENSIEGISLNYIATSNTSIYYTISGLDSNTQYTITSAELNGISTNDINLSFTTLETPAIVNSIEIIDESITNSSAQIKVTTSTTNFDENDLILHLANHDGDLTTTTPVDGITLTHDSTDGTEIYYTILGLESEQEFTITNAKLNNVEKNIDLSFTTKRTEIKSNSLSPAFWIIIEIIILLIFLIICYLIFI